MLFYEIAEKFPNVDFLAGTIDEILDEDNERGEFTSSNNTYETPEGEEETITINARKYSNEIGMQTAAQAVVHFNVLEQYVIKDALTGVYNSNYLRQEIFPHAVKESKRKKQPLSGLFIDLRKFKVLNDTYGHPKGDEMLKSVAELIEKESRGIDRVARLGGDEYFILSPNTDEQGISLLKDRLEEAQKFYNEGITDPIVRMKMDIGAVTLHDNFEQLIEKADEQMYLRKQENGRR